jgi:hypothetical protein
MALGLCHGACSGERYARPSGPAPSYEAAPLPPWDAGAERSPDGREGSLKVTGESSRAALPSTFPSNPLASAAPATLDLAPTTNERVHDP